jgi:AcrR family transcriptional regulator
MARPQQIAAADIKTAARRQMSKLGTAGLTLRGIARDLNVTAPAIYNYFPRLDDLITALIVDAFVAVAEAMEHGEASAAPAAYADQIAGVLRAYRGWALANPTDFQLIFGNPIPGYIAPTEITVPASIRASTLFTRPIARAMLNGYVPPAPPASVLPYLMALLDQLGLETPIPPESIYWGTVAHSRAHGAIMLELHGHLLPVVGDGDAYFDGEIRRFLTDIRLVT